MLIYNVFALVYTDLNGEEEFHDLVALAFRVKLVTDRCPRRLLMMHGWCLVGGKESRW